MKEFIIEIQRPEGLDPYVFSDGLRRFFDIHVSNGAFSFEVFPSLECRKTNLYGNGISMVRYSTIELKNTVIGTKLNNCCLDPSIDSYYASVLVDDSVEFDSKGKFVIRAAVYSDYIRIHAIDYVLKYKGVTDEVQDRTKNKDN